MSFISNHVIHVKSYQMMAFMSPFTHSCHSSRHSCHYSCSFIIKGVIEAIFNKVGCVSQKVLSRQSAKKKTTETISLPSFSSSVLYEQSVSDMTDSDQSAARKLQLRGNGGSCSKILSVHDRIAP
jgi:hypothetical protein